MISLVTLIEFFESVFASIKRRNAEKAAAEAIKTSRIVDDGKAAVADIDAELAKGQHARFGCAQLCRHDCPSQTKLIPAYAKGEPNA